MSFFPYTLKESADENNSNVGLAEDQENEEVTIFNISLIDLVAPLTKLYFQTK